MSIAPSIEDRPTLVLSSRAARRVADGHPWVYANELDMTGAPKDLAAGALVHLANGRGDSLGTAMFNRHSLIAARLLTRSIKTPIDVTFFKERLESALALRARLFDRPFYRLVHAEADALPGLVIDRFGSTFSLQINSAGMEALQSEILEALDGLIESHQIVLRKDSPARRLEQLETGVEVVKGTIEGPVALEENGVCFFADLAAGQKTGWFYDQRDNRRWAAALVSGARVLDGFTYSGGFAVTAAVAGARQVTALDRSDAALDLAEQAARANDVAARCSFEKTDVMAALRRFGEMGETFELVIMDPPAFVKSKKDLKAGLKGYRKLARLAANVVAPDGILFMASCSHNVGETQFLDAVAGGLRDCGRSGRIIRRSGASADHPIHPALPESAYLKALGLALD